MEVYFFKVYQWIEETKLIAPDVCDWIGVYFKESYLRKIESSDLVLGPYIGENTEHVRIPMNRGFCGMALTEERSVNVGDVSSDSRHIACSLKTKSELVIPIPNREGVFVAELDIDCNQLNAFSSDLQSKFEERIKSFPLYDDYVPFKKTPFETQRLILRQLDDQDINDIFEYCSNPEVSRYVTWETHQSLDDSKKLINYAKGCYAEGTIGPLAIVLKDDPQKKVIGTVGLMIDNSKNRTFELAYALAMPHWGKGLIVEASKELIDYAFKNYALLRIQCRCISENGQSSRVMEKLGMTYEGVLRSAMYTKGMSRDIKMYSLLKSEWKSNS